MHMVCVSDISVYIVCGRGMCDVYMVYLSDMCECMVCVSEWIICVSGMRECMVCVSGMCEYVVCV